MNTAKKCDSWEEHNQFSKFLCFLHKSIVITGSLQCLDKILQVVSVDCFRKSNLSGLNSGNILVFQNKYNGTSKVDQYWAIFLMKCMCPLGSLSKLFSKSI